MGDPAPFCAPGLAGGCWSPTDHHARKLFSTQDSACMSQHTGFSFYCNSLGRVFVSGQGALGRLNGPAGYRRHWCNSGSNFPRRKGGGTHPLPIPGASGSSWSQGWESTGMFGGESGAAGTFRGCCGYASCGLEPFSLLCQPRSTPCPSALCSCPDKAKLSVLVCGV